MKGQEKAIYQSVCNFSKVQLFELLAGIPFAGLSL